MSGRSAQAPPSAFGRWLGRDHPSDYVATTTQPGVCPKWGVLGHNWISIKGWLPWRRYLVCVACHHMERVS